MLKKYVWALIVLFGLGNPVSGQVNLTVQVSPTGLIQKAQLWNLLLVNSGSPVTVVIEVRLLSTANNNQPVISGTSANILLPTGAKQLAYTSVQPVQYTYNASVADRNANGFLPVGSYTACYTVLKYESDALVPVAEECLAVEVEPLSPPMLNLPADGSVLDMPYPQFSWLPPSPVSMFSNLSYNLVLVKILNGQTPAEAVQENVPFYTVQSRNLFLNYPSSRVGLDTSNTFAWQVMAMDNNLPAAQSEVWTFKLKDSLRTQTAIIKNYAVELSAQEQTAVHKISGDILVVKYYSYDSPHEGPIEIVDASGTVVRQASYKIIYGDNFITVPLNSSVVEGKTYVVRIANNNKGYSTANFSRN